VTSEVADVVYKCTDYYDPSAESGISFKDPDIGIEWPDLELSPSERDAGAPLLRDVEGELPFVFEASATIAGASMHGVSIPDDLRSD
jgi:dTDP-4-dehydrorhamnose 3,5-epimerase